ncbi:MAG: alpha/beta fold hydrolase [Candidatus Yanofskybacteria bacterium]|nr:alpha/beta fold hydrolase [Candidatus Yanofskybacteria bacterium]
MSKINFKVGKENIVGKILGKNPEKLSDFILFHGAGKSTKERAKEFFDESLFDVVSSIVTFDFSGHGESTGELKKSSLRQRVAEAQTAIELFTTKEKLTVCGSSMGGYIALKMLTLYDIKNLVLFAPAIYDKQAFDVQFDQGFTEILQQSESWKNSDVLESLEKFSGNLLLFIGKDDEIIPRGVVDLVDKHSVKVVRKEIIRFDNCPHAIHAWLDSHSPEKKQVAEKISEYYLV